MKSHGFSGKVQYSRPDRTIIQYGTVLNPMVEIVGMVQPGRTNNLEQERKQKERAGDR